jgi:multiple sugar transport system substrate-binding protein
MNRRAFLMTATALPLSLGLGSIARADGALAVLLPPWGTLPKEMTDKYTAETGLSLSIETLGWDEIRTKIVTSMVANTAPASGTELDWSWVGQFGAAGWYDDLSAVIPAEALADIPTAAIFTYDGKLLGVPYSNDFRVMIYNKAHLDAAGAAVPVTMDDLLAAARAVKAKGAAEYPIGLPLSVSEGAATAWYLLTKAFGGDLFDADFKPLFLAPDTAGYKAMQFEVDALKEGLIDPAATSLKDNEIQELFKAGKITFDLAGQAGIIAVYTDPEKSQVAADAHAGLVPNVTGVSRSFGLPEAIGVPTLAENKDQAATFLNWMLQPEVMEANYKALGVLPTRISVLNQLAKDGKLREGDILAAQAAVAEPLFAQGTPGWYPEFSGAVQAALNAAAKGQITVDVAMQQIADAAAAAQQ